MGFENSSFDTPSYLEEEKEPSKLLLISTEGRNTEVEYFNSIKEKLSEHIDLILEVEVYPKNDNPSEPMHVLANLQKFIEKYDFQSGNDEGWLVIDREKINARKQSILDIKPECDRNNYNIALTNPLFEFWLLMHVADITDYSEKDLFENNKISTRCKFIDKALSEALEGGYSKKAGRFNKNIVSIENIRRALEQEQKFDKQFAIILDGLGSNVGKLIKKIVNIEEN